MEAVFEALAGTISRELRRMADAAVYDDDTFVHCGDAISDALRESEVPLEVARKLGHGITEKMKEDRANSGVKPTVSFVKAVLREIYDFLYPAAMSENHLEPVLGDSTLVVLFGLGDCRSTCSKYLHYLAQKDKKIGLITVPKDEGDAVKFARNESERLKQDGVRYDFVVVDIIGHKEDSFDMLHEMEEVFFAMEPKFVYYVVDSKFDQAAINVAQQFKLIVDKAGAVIISGIDGHPKALGTICGVAAGVCPLHFYHFAADLSEIKVFEAKIFVYQILGVFLRNQQPDFLQRISIGDYTIRMLLSHFDEFSLILGYTTLSGPEKRHRYEMVMSTMTDQEIDNPKAMCFNNSILGRISGECESRNVDVISLVNDLKELVKICF